MSNSPIPNHTTQQLVDQRLDAIDRALLGLLPRNDRVTIVTKVETRLRELAAASDAVAAHQQLPAESPTPADTAQFGAPGESALLPAGVAPAVPGGGNRSHPARLKRSRLALSSGVLGIVALVSLFVFPVSYLVVSTFGELFEVAAIVLMGAHLGTVAICGTLAVALGIVALVRLNRGAGQMAGHGWAITGLCTGPLPMFVGGLIVLVAGLELLPFRSVEVTQVATQPVYPVASPPVCQAAPDVSVQYAPVPPSYVASPAMPMTSPQPISAIPAGYPPSDYPTDASFVGAPPTQADPAAPPVTLPQTVR